MIGATFGAELRRLLVLGAHSDDIEIGAGATLARLARTRPDLHVDWVVFSASGERGDEARRSAEAFLRPFASSGLQVFEFRDGFFPWHGAAIKERCETLKSGRPDLVLTHGRDDAHQDHRLVAELTWNTFRNQPVLEYEIPKWDGDLGRPNVYVPVSRDDLAFKVDTLMTVFGSQRSRAWFDPETFRGLARLRGVECNADSGVAEGFHGRKLVLDP
jgi:LmbE family N-acetylglucosaminyl deacetylase